MSRPRVTDVIALGATNGDLNAYRVYLDREVGYLEKHEGNGDNRHVRGIYAKDELDAYNRVNLAMQRLFGKDELDEQ